MGSQVVPSTLLPQRRTGTVLRVYAQRKYQGQDLPEGWGEIEFHILSCEECQYDVSAAMDAMRTEEEAMMEVLFPESS